MRSIRGVFLAGRRHGIHATPHLHHAASPPTAARAVRADGQLRSPASTITRNGRRAAPVVHVQRRGRRSLQQPVGLHAVRVGPRKFPERTRRRLSALHVVHVLAAPPEQQREWQTAAAAKCLRSTCASIEPVQVGHHGYQPTDALWDGLHKPALSEAAAAAVPATDIRELLACELSLQRHFVLLRHGEATATAASAAHGLGHKVRAVEV